MLDKIKKYLLVLIIILFTGTLFAQWEQHYGPRGRASILYADSYVVFTYIDSSRIYKTVPGADNWVEAHTGIPGNYMIHSLIQGSNESQFFVTASAGVVRTVFVTNNQGESWNQTSLELPNPASYLAYIDSVVFVAANTSSGSPLHYSNDLGATWQECNGMEANGLTSMVKCDSILYASTNLGIFVSVDKGVNWVKKNSDGLPQYSSFSLMIRHYQSNSSKVFGIINSYPSLTSYSSTDAGDTWIADTTIGLPESGGQYFYSTPVLSSENIYVIATEDASTTLPTIYTSPDYGKTWSQLGVPPFYSANQIRIGDGVYVGTVGGILKSNDWGDSWEEFSSGIIYNGNTRGFASANGKLFTTSNGNLLSIGAYPSEWSNVAVPDSLQYFELISFNNILFLYSSNGFVKSEDAGVTWVDIFANLPEGFQSRTIQAGDSKIYLSGSLNSKAVLLYSSDFGNSWNSNEMPTQYVADFKAIGNSVYMRYDKLYKTTDDGATWLELGTAGIDNPSRINSFTESNGTVLVYIWDINNPQVLYSDDGNSWMSVSGLEMENKNIINSFYAKDNLVFAATKKGVFLSTDNGKTWSSKSEGIGTRDVRQIYDQGKYYVASVRDRAVWFIAKPKITDVEIANNELPKSFVLKQNYPNPFNPSTTFLFSIPTTKFVTLSIYNTLGEKVANIVNKNMQAGNYKFNWSANNLTSGIYFARLSAGANIKVQKIMLLK